ncbi:MAG: nicotinamide-nucleotide amidohydrolase family protein, partial [Bacteroidales bacterium]|nr:nicotinamide-nucleotide amidohydrolase family protein [Bacteroidales bacterium]
ETICEFFNSRLVINEEVLSMIEEMIRRRGTTMNENNRKQAMVPDLCRVLYNKMGTAPGLWFEKEKTIFVFMPGVPYEMKYIMSEHVLPELKKQFSSRVIIHRNIMTYGAPEARLAELLSEFESDLPPDIKLAYLPSFGIIKLRLTGSGSDRNAVDNMIGEQADRLYSIIPEYIYAEDEKPFEMVIGNFLKERKQTICAAESCTGGNISRMITSIPGSSAYFKGSVIAYDNSVKSDLLGVPRELFDKFGAVSEEVVKAMANGVRNILGTHYSVATSGIAGPDGGTESRPVGTVWIAAASVKGTVAEKQVFGNDRNFNITRFSNAALNLVLKQITG